MLLVRRLRFRAGGEGPSLRAPGPLLAEGQLPGPDGKRQVRPRRAARAGHGAVAGSVALWQPRRLRHILPGERDGPVLGAGHALHVSWGN